MDKKIVAFTYQDEKTFLPRQVHINKDHIVSVEVFEISGDTSDIILQVVTGEKYRCKNLFTHAAAEKLKSILDILNN